MASTILVGKAYRRGPPPVLIHLASTNVQFTSEAKEAVSDNVEVHEEIRRAMLEVGRGLKNHLKRVNRKRKLKKNST